MPNPKTAFLVRTRLPWHDETQISYDWAEAVKRSFEANGWLVTDLAADDAVRSRVETLLQTSETIVFLFYGHGKPDRMIGQDGNALIDIINRQLLKDRKTYVVACWTAEVLGERAADIVRFYLGYRDEVSVWFPPHYADCLGKCINKGILDMLGAQSCTIGQARQHIVDEYNRWIDHFAVGAGVSDPYSAKFAADLVHDRDQLAQVFGDGTATLTD